MIAAVCGDPLPQETLSKCQGEEDGMLDLILAIIAAVLIFLDLVLWHTTEYKRQILLQFGALLLAIVVILIITGIGTSGLS
jgi:hypothetical protein